MSNRWSWRPVLVGGVLLGVLGVLHAGFWVLVLEEGHPPAIVYVKDLVYLGLPSLLFGGLIGASLGALLAVIRKRARRNREETRRPE